MTHELRYGTNSTVRISLPEDVILGDYRTPQGDPLDDVSAAVAAALDAPIDFPPLRRATVPGDRVAITIDQGIPQLPYVLAGCIHSLTQDHIDPGDICLIFADQHDFEQTNLSDTLPTEISAAIQISLHDPANEKQVAYLAASTDGQPIYMNRKVVEADVVLPISTFRLQDSFGYLGVHSGLFPTFADEKTQKRFRLAGVNEWREQFQRFCTETDEAAWLLGVLFTLQIVPGSGSSIIHVLAGDAHSVSAHGKTICDNVWRKQAPSRAALVVATIEGGPEQQSWENLSRALFSATQVVRDDGAIVLCTDLTRSPGTSLRRLSSSQTDELLLREIRQNPSQDSLSAALLLEARQRARVYLLSGLPADDVEQLGMACVTSEDELDHLSQQFDSCILVSNAQQTILTSAVD